MPKPAEMFIARLHREYLKPRGYSKARHTFSRDLDQYTERVSLQGSSWNQPGSPWRFYVNFGVEFLGLPRRSPDRDFPATHCWSRMEAIVPMAPSHYDLVGDGSHLASEITSYVELASQLVSERIQNVRERYERERTPRLTSGE